MGLEKMMFVSILLVSMNLWGQPMDKGETEVSEEIVVTAQFMPESAKHSVYKVRILDAERIEAMGANNLRELLGHELSMDVENASVFGSSISIQGLSFENVKILVDGVPIIGRLNGIIDLSHLNLEGIERVEIIEGPTSVYYGTDALAGVVNLIPKKEQSDRYQASLDGYYESVGDRIQNGSAGFYAEKQSVVISGGQRDFDGYSPMSEGRGEQWNGRDQYYGDLTYTRHLGTYDLTYGARFFDEELFDLGEPEAGTASDITYQTKRYGHNLTFKGAPTQRHYLDFQLAYSNYERNQATFIVDNNSGDRRPSDNPASYDRTAFRQWLGRGMLASVQSSEKLGYQIGYELSVESGEGARIDDGKQQIEDYAGFVSARYTPFPNLIIQPALRYAYNSAYDAPVTPALNLKFTGASFGDFRASYARGFRSPSLKQLFLDFTMPAGPFIFHITGSDALEAERGHNLNLSHSWQKRTNSSNFKLDTSLFYNDIENLITLSVLQPIGNPGHFERHYINVDTYKTKGGRILFGYSRTNFSATAGLSRTSIYNDLSEDNQVPEFSNSTDVRGDLAWRPSRLGINFNLFYKYNGTKPGYYVFTDRSTGTREIRETSLESNEQLESSISRSFFEDVLELSFGGKNLFDVKNMDTVDLTSGSAHAVNQLGWGRTWYLRARILWRR